MKATNKLKWENVITNIQGNVLEGLARYKFLTLSQMLKLQVGTTRYKYLWEQVKSLRDRRKPLVSCHRYENPEPRKGRVEDMYFLTNVGKTALVNELLFSEQSIKMPAGNTPAYKDYFHRRNTIDFQISLDRWANTVDVLVPFFDTYFDMTGNNRMSKDLRAKTKVDLDGEDYFIPDGVFRVEAKKQQRLFLFEMYNGKDSGRVVEQLHKHAMAMTERHTHRSLGYDPKKSYTIVLVFEFDGIKKAVIEKAKKELSERGKQSFAKVQQYFICKSLEELEKGKFDKNWTTLFGRRSDFF